MTFVFRAIITSTRIVNNVDHLVCVSTCQMTTLVSKVMVPACMDVATDIVITNVTKDADHFVLTKHVIGTIATVQRAVNMTLMGEASKY